MKTIEDYENLIKNLESILINMPIEDEDDEYWFKQFTHAWLRALSEKKRLEEGIFIFN